jgi:hypothetical protein
LNGINSSERGIGDVRLRIRGVTRKTCCRALVKSAMSFRVIGVGDKLGNQPKVLADAI